MNISIQVDKKTFWIGILTLSLAILVAANLIAPVPAAAEVAVKDRDYQLITATSTQGGDSLYVSDNRTGLMAVFSYDPAQRTIVLRDVRPVADALMPK